MMNPGRIIKAVSLTAFFPFFFFDDSPNTKQEKFMFCENFSFLMILLGLGKGRSVGFYFGLFLEVTKENLMICF